MRKSLFMLYAIRDRKRTITNILLLTTTTLFFCASLNLYINSKENLDRANDTYSTIAVMELYGDIDVQGNLVEDLSGNYAGYLQSLVYNYDLTPIVSSDYVVKHDLRYRYTAYIPGHAAYNSNNMTLYPGSNSDIIRFVIEGQEPLAVEIGSGKINYSESRKVTILESAAGIFDYPSEMSFWLSLKPKYRDLYQADILELNADLGEESTDTLFLYPGVEYIMCAIPDTTERIPETGHFVTSGRMRITYDSYGEDYTIQYTSGGEITYRGIAEGQPFWIHRWDQVQSDPELMAYYEAAMNAAKYTVQTLPVTLTEDVSGIAPFHLGAAYLVEGRLVSEEEYAAGAEVCMISSRLAENQGWQVGDIIDMEIYDGGVFPNVYSGAYLNPTYNKNTTGIFDQGKYQIVGIFGQRELTGNSGISAETLAQPWNNIYIPKKSVTNRPDEGNEPVHGVLLTLWLENDSVDAFLNEMEARGITEPQIGGYEAKFTIYDQGYSQVQPSLQALLSTAKLLLVLSSILLAVTLVLVAYFFTQSYKHTLGIFRMLGGTKGQAIRGVICCALLIAMLSTVLGMVSGAQIVELVCEKMITDGMAKTAEELMYEAYSTGMESTEAMELSVSAQPKWVVLSGAASFGLFLLFVRLGIAGYIGKEPRALLPQQKG